MEIKLGFKVCSCGRHGYFTDPETRERLPGCVDVFSQDDAVEILMIIFQTRKQQISVATLQQFKVSLSETSLPVELPLGFDHLMELDNRMDDSCGLLPDSEEEMKESIHEFLDMFFPHFCPIVRVAH